MDPELEPFLRILPKHLRCAARAELPDACTALAASRGAPLVLAVGTFEREVRLYDEELHPLRSLEGHAGGAVSLAFGSGTTLVSTGEDGTAAAWDAASGALMARLQCEGEHADRTPDGHTVSNAACSTSGSLAACSAGRTLHLWALRPDGHVEASRRVFPPVSGGVIEDVRFVSDARLLVAYYGGVALFSTAAGAPGTVLEYGTNVLCVAATPTLSYIVGGCMDSCVHVWRLAAQPGAAGAAAATADVEEEFSCGGYTTKVSALEYDASGTALASLGGAQGTVWDFSAAEGPAGTSPVVLLGHTKNAVALAWAPGASRLLATSGRDGRVLVYDIDVYAEPEDEGMPKFCAPVAVAPQPAADECTHLAWPEAGPGALYVAHSSGELVRWDMCAEEQQPAAEQQPADVGA